MVWEIISAGLGGVILGALGVYYFKRENGRTAEIMAAEVFAKAEEERRRQMEAMSDLLKAQFGELSLKALSRNTEDFLKLAESRFSGESQKHGQELEGKKNLIDQQLDKMTNELKSVAELVKRFENDREQKFGQLTTEIKNASSQTALLLKTTQSLREALANTKARGQWGERMAEDVLRSAGFIENINYRKQTKNTSGTLPDFTFILPRGLTLNMDVKFPYENYMRFLDASIDTEKQRFRQDYMRDIKTKIKEVTSRDYINPNEHTVDYVLLFIPNEQIYAFIHENDPALLDEAIKKRVVMCSPITLFAVLAVIRQATENFAMEKTSNEILRLMGVFNKQWGEFTAKMDKMGERINDAQREFEMLMSTRKNQLERPLRQIEDLRSSREESHTLAVGTSPPTLEIITTNKLGG